MLSKASKSNNYHYNAALKNTARKLRNNSTKAEILLWSDVLRAGYMNGYQFLRQRPILNYIADFVCLNLMLIVEVDGITHEIEEVAARDIIRQQALESVGFTVLRFSDWEVLERRADVAEALIAWIEDFDRNRVG
jgi:very-short-patch-repair endonuclease